MRATTQFAALVILAGTTACGAGEQRVAQLEAAVARLDAKAAAQEAELARRAAPLPAEAAEPADLPLAATAGKLVTAPPSDTFVGWLINGTNVPGFTVVHDPVVKQAGVASARIECVVPKGGRDEFGGMMQVIAADNYRGSRVRFSAFVRTKDVAGWVGLWMRVDRPTQRASAFDNMQDRPIKGSADWKRHAVVLDVAADADSLNYGLILADGKGTAWLDDVLVEVVPSSVPVTTAMPQSAATPSRLSPTPLNLNLDS